MKKWLFLLSLTLVFALIACTTEEEPPEQSHQETLETVKTALEALEPLAGLTIDLNDTAHQIAAVKRYLEALDVVSTHEVAIAVSHNEGAQFVITLSKGNDQLTMTMNVVDFMVSDEDFSAIVQEAKNLIDALDFLELDVTQESNEAREAALKAYLQALPEMAALNVSLTVTFNEETWGYDILVSRANVALETTLESVYFNVVREVIDTRLYAMVDAVRAHFGDAYYPAQFMHEQMFEEMVGVNLAWVVDYYAEGPMFTMGVDTMIGVRAQSGHLNDVKSALEAYQNYLIHDAFQYAMNYPIVEASLIHVVGDHVFFIMLSQPLPDGTEDPVAFYTSINQQAIDQINAAFNAS